MAGKGKLATESYKGVRDFYPEDMAALQHIFSVWRKTAQSFGYVEYGASILEPTEIYAAKSGEEIVNEQTYSFVDRGEREVTLRPEMTPTVARMIAARRRDLSMPVRWFSIPNVFRYERPQRGRLREHFQLNCDIFGLNGLEADIEIIAMAAAVMKNFGALPADFEIRVNSRGLLKKALADLGLDDDQSAMMQKLIDKKDKMEPALFAAEAEKIADGLGDKVSDKELFGAIALAETDVEKVIDALNARGIDNVRFDPTIVRGFDYYTGVVFEIYDTNRENPRAIFGGGRYDGLTSLFEGQNADENLAAVGFGIGDVTTRDFLETHGLLPSYRNPTDLTIALADEGGEAKACAESVAETLRSHNLNISIDYSGKKIGEQIKKADKEGVLYVTVIGADEASSNTFKIKNLASGDEVIVDGAEEVAAFLKNAAKII